MVAVDIFHHIPTYVSIYVSLSADRVIHIMVAYL